MSVYLNLRPLPLLHILSPENPNLYGWPVTPDSRQ
jgi:hypothetical protein